MDLLNTIGQVGDSLDKVTGGRALRGTLAGKPRELASFIPYSDEMGLTNAKDKTSGRDLTDQYGLTSKGSNSFGSHAAGFLADAALSPASLIGAYGAFKAAPTLAKGVVGAGKALSGLDLFDHLKSGGKALGNLARGESGALHLPFDKLAVPPKGLAINSPEWVNNRTFYHGGATPGITSASLNPMETLPHNYVGRGIYTTDDSGLAAAYAKAAKEEGRGTRRRVYQSQSDFNKILNVDDPVTDPAAVDAFRDVVSRIPASDAASRISRYGPNKNKSLNEILADALASQNPDDGGTGHSLFRGLITKHDPIHRWDKLMPGEFDAPSELIRAFKERGIDALTHKGDMGLLDRPNAQVVVGLDPNNMIAPGSKPYKTWEPATSGDGMKRQTDAMFGLGKKAQAPAAAAPRVNLSSNGGDLSGGLNPWQRAETIGSNAGVRTKMIDKSTAAQIAKANQWTDPAELTAWYKGDKHVIGLNPNAPEWFDHGAMRDYMQSVGPGGTEWLSSSHPDHIIQHELGHAAHREGLGMDAFMNDPALRAAHDPMWEQFIKNNLSHYGATKPTETVAELIAALQGGRNLDPNLITPLKHFGGNNLFQNLGDHGLLKGLGLSALLGAGTMGASGGGPEQLEQPGAA